VAENHASRATKNILSASNGTLLCDGLYPIHKLQARTSETNKLCDTPLSATNIFLLICPSVASPTGGFRTITPMQRQYAQTALYCVQTAYCKTSRLRGEGQAYTRPSSFRALSIDTPLPALRSLSAFLRRFISPLSA